MTLPNKSLLPNRHQIPLKGTAESGPHNHARIFLSAVEEFCRYTGRNPL
jgi:hypothetical protein